MIRGSRGAGRQRNHAGATNCPPKKGEPAHSVIPAIPELESGVRPATGRRQTGRGRDNGDQKDVHALAEPGRPPAPGPARAVAGLLALVLIGVAGCTKPGYEVERPWADNPSVELEEATIGGVTRSAVRRARGPGQRIEIPLGPVEPGVLVTALGPAAPPPAGARAEVWIQQIPPEPRAPGRCRLAWTAGPGGAGWRTCRISIATKARDARLVISARGGRPAEWLIGSPVLISRRARPLPPVFVFLIDTVRADVLSGFRPESPIGGALAEFARDAITFTGARASSSWTRTAVATLFTGLPAEAHKVLDRRDVLVPEFETLPEILQQRGYRTFAWSANPNILPMWGFGQGFDVFVDIGAFDWNKAKTDGARVLAEVRKAVDADAALSAAYYVHLMDAHSPYLPDAVHVAAVRGTERARALRPPALDAADGIERFEAYLAEVLDLDEQLGEFFGYLKEKGLYDDAMILVVSDHGEEFLDHGDYFHGKTLYEEVLHVPVLLKLPGSRHASTRRADPVDFADVLQTVLRALGLPPPAGAEGRALALEGTGGGAVTAVPQVATLKLDGRHLTSIVTGGWKLVVNHAGPDQLFHLAEDPGETRDLFGVNPLQAAALRRLLDNAVAAHQQGWHVRGCGGDEPATVRFTLAPGGDVQAFLFEADDGLSVSPAEEGGRRLVRVTMNLPMHGAKREQFGRLIEEMVRDEDEVLAPSAGGGGEAVVTLSVVGDGTITYALGLEDERRRAREVRLGPDAPGALVKGSDAVECVARGGGEVAGGPAAAYLRVWYVPPPERRAEAAVDPAVAERLRALGYK